MVKRDYQVELDGKNFAKAMAVNKPISLKYSTEMCREIRGKPIKKVEAFLNRIITHDDYLPLRRYNAGVGHRKGDVKSFTKSGRFPEKVCENFLDLLENLKANADFKGMDEEKLLIVHSFACQGFRRMSYQSKGKISGRRRLKKSTNIEVIAVEMK